MTGMWTPAEVSRELEFAQRPSPLLQRFQDDGNVSRCYSTRSPLGAITCRVRTGICVTAKETDEHSIRSVSVSLLQLPGTTVSRQESYRR
ncbi:hypothetical protein AVEN_200707-1 [Araneus ventricosus]|uniref:Uncharacterized protein n=1 Tax=Araneus ventricosus TaxID=182803 RepID=A0A4Y2ILT2_ARAVE|nr:hypothetical protein AVEN_200707-1 [Araneus ventricosus]